MLPARNSLGLLSVITSARGTSALWLHKPLHNHLGSIKIRRYGDSITLLAFLWSPPHLCLPFHGALHISACILINLLIPACIYNLSIIFLEMQIPLISSWAPAHIFNRIAYFSIFNIGQDASSYPLNIPCWMTAKSFCMSCPISRMCQSIIDNFRLLGLTANHLRHLDPCFVVSPLLACSFLIK